MKKNRWKYYLIIINLHVVLLIAILLFAELYQYIEMSTGSYIVETYPHYIPMVPIGILVCSLIASITITNYNTKE